MTAYVLGATGFVGREVVRQLCVRGTQTYAHVRPESAEKARMLASLGAIVDAVPWDVDALASRWRAIRPAQIYILIGTTRAAAKRDGVQGDIYEAVDLRLTKLAIDAARASEVKPRIVYLSSVGATATARSAYLRARGRAEEVVQTSRLPWVIARPSFITGDRDETRIGERAAALFGDGALAVAGLLGGKTVREKYRSTTPDVLASALIRLGEAPEHDRVAEGSDLR